MTHASHATQSADGPELDSLLSILRCPATGRELRREGDGLESDGEHVYAIVDGVPILLRRGNDIYDPDAPMRRATPRIGRLAAALRWQPSLSKNVAAAENFALLVELLKRRSEELQRQQRVLVVGGATAGIGFSRLLGHPFVELVETDIALGPRTRIVCDVQSLPFSDGSFDGVVCQAVLEYVPDPYRAVAEIHRVLHPSGLVYSEIPFLQQVHGPFDFMRFTHLGHRRLYRNFDEVRTGVTGGPGMSLGWSWRAFLVACGGRSRLARLGASRVAALTAFWLPRLDDVLARQPGGFDAAAGTFFLGTRRETPVTDAEILRGYRGAQRTLWKS